MGLVVMALLIVIGAIAFLTLSAVGHVSSEVKALAARQEELFIDGEHTRAYVGKALIEDRLLPHLGFKEPEPTLQERQFNAIVSSPEFQKVVEADAKTEFEKVHGAGYWDAGNEIASVEAQ